MNTKVSEEEAQQDTYQPVFLAYVRVVIQPASAFFTKSGIVIYECPTFTAIHNLEFKVTDTTKIIPFSKNGVALKELMVNYMTKLRSSKNATAKVVSCCLIGF